VRRTEDVEVGTHQQGADAVFIEERGIRVVDADPYGIGGRRRRIDDKRDDHRLHALEETQVLLRQMKPRIEAVPDHAEPARTEDVVEPACPAMDDDARLRREGPGQRTERPVGGAVQQSVLQPRNVDGQRVVPA
jgi:hypothetical protein